MGLVANYPIALAPGMGLNAFFTYTVVLTMGYTADRAGCGVPLRPDLLRAVDLQDP